LPQAAGETLVLVAASLLAGVLLRRLPLVGPFIPALTLAAIAQLLLYQASMKVTWLPPRAFWKPAVRLTVVTTAWFLLPGAILVHMMVMAVASRDPGVLRAAWAQMASVPVWVMVHEAIRTAVAVPLAEELAFRGYMHSRLLRYDARRYQLGKATWSRAALVSGGLFAIIHLTNYPAFWLGRPSPVGLMAWHVGWAFAVGVAAAVLLEKTGSLLAPMVLHGSINLWAFLYRLVLVAYLAAQL
jgi:membrane protease YdiL (CAAX protease family)